MAEFDVVVTSLQSLLFQFGLLFLRSKGVFRCDIIKKKKKKRPPKHFFKAKTQKRAPRAAPDYFMGLTLILQ